MTAHIQTAAILTGAGLLEALIVVGWFQGWW
jgi:hypothetical protein